MIENIGYPVRGVVPGDGREGHFNVSEENNGRTAVGGPLMLVLYVGEEDVGHVVCLETRSASQASEHIVMYSAPQLLNVTMVCNPLFSS